MKIGQKKCIWSNSRNNSTEGRSTGTLNIMPKIQNGKARGGDSDAFLLAELPSMSVLSFMGGP